MSEMQAVEILQRVADAIERIDIINQRLVTAIAVICVSFCVMITFIAYFYFTTDYSYPQVNQTQSNSSNIEIKKGGN